jgi:hypothetical protein
MGTFTQQSVTHQNYTASQIDIHWKAKADGSVYPIVLNDATFAGVYMKYLMYATTVPGPSLFPSDNYDITISNSAGTDVMGGTLANRDAVAHEHAYPAIGGAQILEPLTIAITGNSVNGAEGTIQLLFSPLPVSISGANTLFLQGNVGILNSSPSVALDVTGTIASSAINTTGVISAAETITEATHATQRLIRSELTLTPATDIAATSNGSFAGIRGAVTLSSGKSISDGYIYGVQGKAVLDGATLAVGSDHICGLYGQLSATSATFTSGHIAAVIGSIQGVPTSSNVDLFYGESVTGNVINAMFKAICKSDFVFDLESNVHTQMGTAGAATTAAGWLKIKVEGVTRYINLWSTAP